MMRLAGVAVSFLVELCVMGLGVGAVPKLTCPLPDDIAPCVCDASSGLVMDCSKVKDESELAKVFTAYFPTPAFDELKIHHDPTNPDYKLQSLEARTLGDVTFRRVSITGTGIISIDGYTFDKSKSTLEVLILTGNLISTFPFGSITRYAALTTVLLAHNNLRLIPQLESPVLQVLDVSGNRPLVVEKEAFAGTPSLRRINLSRTNQQSLPHGLFAHLDNLQELDLSDNELEVLEEATIVTPKPSLTFLDLSRNNISFVRHDAIVGLASNAKLVMAGNSITLLTQDHWQHVFDQLQRPSGILNMAENPLLCGCDMAWIVLNPEYLLLFTDTTTCSNGERVIFLDPNIYILMCPHHSLAQHLTP